MRKTNLTLICFVVLAGCTPKGVITKPKLHAKSSPKEQTQREMVVEQPKRVEPDVASEAKVFLQNFPIILDTASMISSTRIKAQSEGTRAGIAIIRASAKHTEIFLDPQRHEELNNLWLGHLVRHMPSLSAPQLRRIQDRWHQELQKLQKSREEGMLTPDEGVKFLIGLMSAIPGAEPLAKVLGDLNLNGLLNEDSF